jgi:hypothetical protein
VPQHGLPYQYTALTKHIIYFNRFAVLCRDSGDESLHGSGNHVSGLDKGEVGKRRIGEGRKEGLRTVLTLVVM